MREVRYAHQDGKLYFRSEPHVAKIRRIKNDPHVRIAACNMRGKPRGPMAEGVARVLPESENDVAYRILRSNWRPAMKAMEVTFDRLGVPAAYVEVAPRAAADGDSAST